MSEENCTKRQKTNKMADCEEHPSPGIRADVNPEHGMKVLHGLNFLKQEKVLCDVTLIAEG